ncbi:MAG: prepilin-type N-terminal cleavage/methylation domain-containing protein [Candidatus Gracilibacteria bacterium]|nr:prepilin-type N-terminal cleavage/methylation domain-containing protein [Candidatus Gracilibacteria bacterium]MDD2908707.1 prepilin-type N-terminal cleavage/methylation domain-containing protein [Candidatus Gracilibacteria bacterium]
MNQININKNSFKKSNNGLTLVELIVAIVILAILSSITFMSFQSYTSQSRDTTRVTNLSLITKGLGVHKITAGKFPLADGGFDLQGLDETLSNPVPELKVGTQGIIGDKIYGSLKVGGSTKDPIDSNPITYATNSKGCKFELLSFFENNDSNSQMQNGVDQGIFMNGNTRRYPFIQGITETYMPGDSNLGIITLKNDSNQYTTSMDLFSDEAENYTEALGLLSNNIIPQDINSLEDYQIIVDNYNKCPSKPKGCEWTEKDYGDYNGYSVEPGCYSWFDDSWFEKQIIDGKGGESTDFYSGLDIPNLPFSIKLPDGNTVNSLIADNYGDLLAGGDSHGFYYRYDSFYWANGFYFDNATSHLYYGYTNDYVIVSWVNMKGYSDDLQTDIIEDSNFSFQTIIYKDGTFRNQYKEINLPSGYESITWDTGIRPNDFYGLDSENGDSLPTAETAILFTPKILPIPEDGECGPINRSYSHIPYKPSNSDMCSAGIPINFYIDAGDGISYHWDCDGINGGVSTTNLGSSYGSCRSYGDENTIPLVTGECGSIDGTEVGSDIQDDYTYPQLCTTGYPDSVFFNVWDEQGGFYYINWQCRGTDFDTADDDNCQAKYITN